MERKFEINITREGLIFAVFEIVFLALAITGLFAIFNRETTTPQISFSNNSVLKDIDGLPDGAQQELERELYDIVAMNTGMDVNLADSGATIREGSVTTTYFKDLDIYYIHLIVDLEKLGQTYQLKYEWSNNLENPNLAVDEKIMAMCPTAIQLTYGDFECVDEYGENGESVILYQYISKNKFSGFNVSLPQNFNQNVVIKGFTITLGTASRNSAISELKNYISALGINAENYVYEIAE